MVAKLKMLEARPLLLFHRRNNEVRARGTKRRRNRTENASCVLWLCIPLLCVCVFFFFFFFSRFASKMSTNTWASVCVCSVCMHTRRCNCGALMCVHQMLRSSSSRKRRTTIERTLFWPHEMEELKEEKNTNDSNWIESVFFISFGYLKHAIWLCDVFFYLSFECFHVWSSFWCVFLFNVVNHFFLFFPRNTLFSKFERARCNFICIFIPFKTTESKKRDAS